MCALFLAFEIIVFFSFKSFAGLRKLCLTCRLDNPKLNVSVAKCVSILFALDAEAAVADQILYSI